MEYRVLGRTETSVSVMSVGSWLTLDHVEPEVGVEVLRTAIDKGVNFFDDARYDDRTGKAPIKTGYSEVVFGELFRKGRWQREDVLIANKAWLEFYPEETVAEEVEGSLVRLQMDMIDLMYVVPPPKELRMTELVEMMSELVASGKVRSWGGLNWKPEHINMAYAISLNKGFTSLSAVQLPYNLLYRGVVEAKEMQDACRRAGVSVVGSFGLGGGLLTGKYSTGSALRQGRLSAKELAYHQKRGVLDKVAALADIAQELSITPAQLALAYCLKGPNVASVVFGATSSEQVEENLGALDAQAALDDTVLKRIRRTLRPSAPGRG